MKIQKLYVEAYVDDGVSLEYELEDQLNNDERCTWYKVVRIREEKTKDTFPKDKEERIRTQMIQIEAMLEDAELNVPSGIGDILQNIDEELRSMLS